MVTGSTLHLKCMGTTPCFFPAIFAKAKMNTFCDIAFASLDYVALPRRVSSLEGKNWLFFGANSFL